MFPLALLCGSGFTLCTESTFSNVCTQKFLESEFVDYFMKVFKFEDILQIQIFLRNGNIEGPFQWKSLINALFVQCLMGTS